MNLVFWFLWRFLLFFMRILILLANVVLKSVPVSAIEGLPLRGDVDVPKGGSLVGGEDEVRPGRQVPSRQVVVALADVLFGQFLRAQDLGKGRLLTFFDVLAVDLDRGVKGALDESGPLLADLSARDRRSHQELCVDCIFVLLVKASFQDCDEGAVGEIKTNVNYL